ncbi:MAG TPA: saccharopine dehydrogenase [Firmicutes bacterium]|nr:saccharopine dehydrogenase [Bacillota bacterium]
MKVIVLGGAGDMGAEAVKDLIGNTDVGQVTIADINTEAAWRLAAALGDRRVVVRRVDARVHGELVEAIKGHDVAAGAMGPFYLFERGVAEAALDAGVDYISICDDHDAVEGVLPLDHRAVAEGRKILTGLGLSPGITNLLARKGYDELEKVNSVKAYWAGSAGDSEGLAVILHTIHIFSGMITSFQEGRSQQIRAGTGREVVEFLPPLGRVVTYHLGHPEPLTLPRYLKGIREVSLKGGLTENYLSILAKAMARLGLTSTVAGKQLLGAILKKALPYFPSDRGKNFMGARVDITGMKKGKSVRITYLLVDHMKRLTGIPLSIGAYMMAQGKIKGRGVFAPEAEGAIDQDYFFNELARRDIKVHSYTL